MCAVTKEFVITTSHLIIDENDISDWNKELHKTRSTFERSDCDVWRKGLVRSLCSNSSQKCSIWLKSERYFLTGLVVQVASCHGTTLEFIELQRATQALLHFFNLPHRIEDTSVWLCWFFNTILIIFQHKLCK